MFRLEIKTGGAAFNADTETEEGISIGINGSEIARLLRKVADKVDGTDFHFYNGGTENDINGNKVLTWTVAI